MFVYYQQPTGEEESQEDEVLDSLGIPGWNKVDSLASALLNLKGMCVSSSDAEKIKKLYNELADFDKQPLVFKARKPKLAKPGRHGRNRFHHSGHTTVDMIRRYVCLWPIEIQK